MNPAASLLTSAFLALLCPALLLAQAAPSAATLAKYDKNNNGRLDADEIAAMQADNAKAAQTPVATASSSSSGEVVTLNPFEVDASKDIGYYAENTLAGSRLKTNVGDLASSITVVTKQQLEDTGALNINDVFLYEANTEGASTYTPLYLNRGNASDLIGGYSSDNGPSFGIAQANRVRGLGSADTAQDNYPSLPRIAFDNYNSNSVEINRGPNSILFGAGGASGVVNQSTTEAALNQQKSRVQARFGSFGAHRESISTNVPVGKKVALFFAALYDNKEFERKPSSIVTKRQFAAITIQPFAQTKITGSFENYNDFNNAPNFNEPQDGVSPWLNAGRPGWDPTTQTITLANGTVSGPFLSSTLDPRWIANPSLTVNGTGGFTSSSLATYIPGITSHGNNVIFFNNGKPQWFFAANGTSGAGTNGATAVPAVTQRTAAQWVLSSISNTQSRTDLTPTPPASTGANAIASYFTPGITDKSIYDWTKYNYTGSNYSLTTNKTYKIELNQQILQGLNLQLGWFRQEMTDWQSRGVGQTNAASTILVDTNTKLMDGRPNPFFGAPFAYDNQTDTYSSPERNNNLRATLAYQHDFTKAQGWSRYLSFMGKATLSAVASQQKDVINRGRWRLSLDGGDPRFLPNQNTGNVANNFTWASSANIERDYYLGGTGSNGHVTQGVKAPREPNFGGPNKLPLSYVDWNSTQTWQTTDMSFDDNLYIAGNGQGVTNKTLDSTSFAYQGSLWNNRIIPTIGTRYDKVRVFVRNGLGLGTTQTSVGGFTKYEYTTTMGAKPYDVGGATNTKGVVARPFSGWRSLDAAAERGSFLADMVRGLGFSYNHSDNFSPPQTLQTDFFSTPLPKPSGKGDDYGIRGSMFNNKLSWNLNWYKSTAEHAVSDAANTAIGRAQRIDSSSMNVWAREVVRIRNGQDPTDVNFDNNTVFPLTIDQQRQVNALVAGPEKDANGFAVKTAFTIPGDPDALPNNTQGTNSLVSKGKELSLIYNPTRNWNIKLTAGQQESSYSKASGEITSWLFGSGNSQKGDGRKNFWENAAAPDLSTVYTRSNGNKLFLGNFWNSYGYGGDANSNNVGALSTPNTTYFGIVDSQLYQLITLSGTKSPGQREYSSSLITNYSFQEGRMKGLAIGGGFRWAANAIVGYYGNLDPATFSHPNSTTNTISFPNLGQPLYIPATTNLDVWASYSTRLPVFGKSVRAKFQFNVQSLTESGGLTPILYQYNGAPATYRITDPRTFFVTTTFDF